MFTGSTILSLSPRRQPTGFTLVESLITLAVASILLTAAVPPMQDFITRNRMSSEVNTFIASLHLARSEAVKRMQNTRICPATFDSTGKVTGCTGGTNWQAGWVVFADSDQSGSFTPGDVVLHQAEALPPRFQVAGDAGRPAVVYQPTGQASGTNNRLTFCDTGNVANTRVVVISNEGRVFVNQLTTTVCPS